MKTQQLKILAQQATPWPWEWFTSNSHNRLSSVASGKDGDVISAFKAADGAACVSISQDNMAFIEAAHPGAVIELIERLEAADKDGREYAILAGTNAARAEKAERERDSLQEQVRALAADNSIQDFIISAVKDLVRESEGVAGWHLNGDIASWDEALPELNHSETPATDAALREVRAQARAEGIHFAANRLLAAWESGFVDDTPAAAHDISGAILSAVEFLPNAFEAEFKRDYADEVRARIRAGEQP